MEAWNAQTTGATTQQTTPSAAHALHTNNYDIKVYSIGFGPVIDCQSANTTLTGIASCGHGTYYGSKDPDKLKFIYGAIAEEILNVTNRSQAINITSGNMAPSILYPESYIEFGYNAGQQRLLWGDQCHRQQNVVYKPG